MKRLTLRDYLYEIEFVLRSHMHGVECDSLFSCPMQCGCNRGFKLNIASALVWELAEQIYAVAITGDKIKKSDMHAIKHVSSYALAMLKHHHRWAPVTNLIANVEEWIEDLYLHYFTARAVPPPPLKVIKDYHRKNQKRSLARFL